MLTFDAQGHQDYVAGLRERNAVLLDQMFGANGIRPMEVMPAYGTRDASILAEFTTNMTEYIDNSLEMEDFPGLTFRRVFSFKTDIPAGDDTYTKYEFGVNGQAQWIDENGNNIPMLATGVAPTTRPLKPLGQGYRITRTELLRATQARIPVSLEKPRAARLLVEEKMDRVFWAGDTGVGIYGLLNHPSIPTADATTGTWSTATAAQIQTDILTVINARVNATLEPNVQYQIGLPIAQYQVITQKELNTYTTETVADWLVRKIPQVSGFFASNRLYQASGDSDDYAVFIPVGSQWGYGLMSQDAMSIGPHQSTILGEDYLIEARIGGFFTLKPLKFAIMEGV